MTNQEVEYRLKVVEELLNNQIKQLENKVETLEAQIKQHEYQIENLENQVKSKFKTQL